MLLVLSYRLGFVTIPVQNVVLHSAQHQTRPIKSPSELDWVTAQKEVHACFTRKGFNSVWPGEECQQTVRLVTGVEFAASTARTPARLDSHDAHVRASVAVNCTRTKCGFMSPNGHSFDVFCQLVPVMRSRLVCSVTHCDAAVSFFSVASPALVSGDGVTSDPHISVR